MKKMSSNDWTKSQECKYFAIVKNQNGKYVIVMGDAQVSPKEFDTIEDAEIYIKSATCELMCEICITLNYLSNENKNKKQTEKVVEESAKSNA